MEEINNNNNNYKYFKLIFGNEFIRKHIFNLVKELNGPNSISFEDTNLIFIYNNDCWNLFKYKVKIGFEFECIKEIYHLSSLFNALRIHFKNENINKQEQDELIIKFYQTNKSSIIKVFIGEGGETIYKDHYKMIDILTRLTIGLRNSTILKLIYNDIYKNEGIKIINRLSDLEVSKIYESVLMIGQVDIISILYNDIKLKFNNNSYISKKALFWSIHSSNSDEMVKFLLDNLGYTIPTTSPLDNTFQDFFKLLIKLDHNLIKRIMKLGSPLLYNEAVLFINIINYSKTLITASNDIQDTPVYKFNSNSFNHILSTKKIIDFIQNSIYISIHNKQNNHNFTKQELLNFNMYYEKINLLIKFNENEIESIKNKLINFDDNNNNNNGYFDFIKSVFKTTTSSPSPQQPKLTTDVKFEEFNLEREVKRIYIFDFLKSNYNRLLDKNVYSSFVINFSSFFNEYELILNLILFEKQKQQEIESSFNNDLIVEKRILSKCLHIASENADIKLLNFIINNLNYKLIDIGTIGLDHGTTSNESLLFDRIQIPINRQIEYLQTIVTLNINFSLSFKVILNHILKKRINQNYKNNSLSIENLHQIRDIINQFIKLHKYKDIDNYFLSNYLNMSKLTWTSNQTVIDYFNKNQIVFN